ncbi:MAG TPA: hypothetical protein VFB22_16105 [Candidatus Baltobacteraceae bacterium]|nr:hypothetical protein [Candidatus Baltobacteraceae bacterium]
MADRRAFLGVVSGAAASVLLAAPAGAQAGAPPAPPACPLPSVRPGAKPASALATATAEGMRRFDARLSDADLRTIAHGIDELRDEAGHLNPHRGTALKNGDEPALRFSAERPA